MELNIYEGPEKYISNNKTNKQRYTIIFLLSLYYITTI